MRHTKLFALLLAAAMLLALASCGGAPAASDSPSPSQSDTPSESPSGKPSEIPSESPSAEPSEAPSEEPPESPSDAPSEKPSEKPSENPSEKPSEKPSESPLPSPTDGKDLVEMGVLPTPKPSTEPTPSASSSPSQDSSVSLQKFYEDLLAKYEDDDFNPNMAVKGDFLTSYYGGLSNIDLEQQVIYQPMMSAVVCEIALAEVKNAADVQKVKDVFQERINAQVGTDDAPGGAFYPDSIEGWKNNSRIVSNGNFVMMIVWEDCDQIVDDFNALF